LVAGRMATIRGRIMIDSNTVAPKASAFNVALMSPMPMMGGGSGRVNNDYTFEIRSTPGHGTINAWVADSEWALHAVKLNGVDITDSGVDVSADALIDGVIVEMTKRFSELTGHVLDENDRPLRDVWVVMFSQDPLRLTPPTRYISAGRPALNNLYRVRVPAGDYFTVALDDVEQGEWNDPDFLARVRGRATRVTIADGERKALDLKLAK